MLLPADDLLESDCIESLSKALAENPSAGIAFGSSISIDESGGKGRVKSLINQAGLVIFPKMVSLIAEQFNPIQHPMVRSKVFAKSGGFEKKYGCFCDIHLWSKVLFSGWDAYYIRRPLTSIRSYRNQGQSLFRQNTGENLKRLSGHYGRTLPSSFFRKNHYNLLFYWFIRFIDRNSRKMHAGRNALAGVLMARLFRSQIGNVCRSLRGLNISMLGAEISLFARITRAYGVVFSLESYTRAVVRGFQSFVGRLFGLKNSPFPRVES